MPLRCALLLMQCCTSSLSHVSSHILHSTLLLSRRQDPVVHLPLRSAQLLHLMYHHTAVEVYYAHSAQGPYTVCNCSGEDQHCSAQHSNLPWNVLHLSDHLSYMQQDFTRNFLQCKFAAAGAAAAADVSQMDVTGGDAPQPLSTALDTAY
jgi:hypothetical protein